MKEISNIFVEKKEVKFGEIVLEIKTIPFGKLPQIAELADKVISKIQKNSSLGDQGIAKAIFELMKEDFASIIKAIEITTNLKSEQIEELNLEAATFVVSQVIEVNADFLSQKVFPQITAMSESIGKKKK